MLIGGGGAIDPNSLLELMVAHESACYSQAYNAGYSQAGSIAPYGSAADLETMDLVSEPELGGFSSCGFKFEFPMFTQLFEWPHRHMALATHLSPNNP